MRSEEAIERKIEQALEEKEAQGHTPSHDGYLRGVREALGWVIEDEDEIPGLDEP
jgi:hypothetical protein